jgi:hypothetical protein
MSFAAAGKYIVLAGFSKRVETSDLKINGPISPDFFLLFTLLGLDNIILALSVLFFRCLLLSGDCPLAVNESKIFKFLFLILFCLVLGCFPQGRLGPEPNTEIVVLDPKLSKQQTISECDVKANRSALNNEVNDGEIFVGFKKQESFGECMNAKGFIWGIQ